MKKLFFVFFTLCLILSSAFASFPQYTDLYVNDFAGVFDQNQTSKLRSSLSQLRNETTAEVVVVTVNSLDGLPAIDYATQLGQTWGVGKKQTDNGLVILYAKTENKIAVATGYGLEGILPDSKVGRILDEYYVPNRDIGDSAQGVVDVTLVYVNEIYQNKNEVGANNYSNSVQMNDFFSTLTFILAVGAILIAIIIGFFMRNLKSDFYSGLISTVVLVVLALLFYFAGQFLPDPYGTYSIFVAIILMIIFSTRFGFIGGGHYYGGGGFSGGGFGGGSFGGGGFGGGGASR